MEDYRPGADGWRTGPMYTIGQAARLAGVHSATVRRWLYGDNYPGRRMRPVFEPRRELKRASAEVSFLQLAEIVIVSRFRRRRVTLERLRRAHRYAREHFYPEYPFARLSLKTDGVHVLYEYQEAEPGASLLALDRRGQWTLPGDVVETLETFDFEEDLAARWFPVGRSIPIVVDPRFGAGKPTIPNRRLTIEAIYKRWNAGQTIRFIASDFRLQPSLVEEAVRFGDKVAA